MNFIVLARDQINDIIKSACQRAFDAGILPGSAEDSAVGVEIPKDEANGDFSSNFALTSAKRFRLPPQRIAQAVCDNIDLSGSYFNSVNIAGAGFINFCLSDRWYGELLANIAEEGADYGSSDIGTGIKVMVEFVSANPTGPMHMGNARGGVLGDCLANAYRRCGFEMHKEFYVNDAGNQVEVFARSLEARYFQQLRGEDALEFPEDGYHGDDIKQLAADYIGQFGDNLSGVSEAERRETLRDFGLRHNIPRMESDLKRYNIVYDRWFRESELHTSGYVAETIELIKRRGYTYEKDGALWFRCTDLGCEKDEVLMRSNGYYTYYASDIAYHRDKFEKRGFDSVIDVLGADHHGHTVRFKAGLSALGLDPDKLHFVLIQLVRLTRDGEAVRMSKRTGKSITLSDLLDEIPCDAARFFFNARQSDAQLEFDLGLAVRHDSENPIYYVQYAHARICSLLRIAEEEGFGLDLSREADYSLLSMPVEKALIKTLARLPEELCLVTRDCEPSRLNTLLVDIARAFHRFYTECNIKDAPSGLRTARLKLANCVRLTIANACGVIGITAPEKM